jgi:hypothetical protein
MNQNKDIFSILVTSNIIGFAERKSNNSFSYKFDSDDRIFSHNNNLYYLSKITSLKDKESSQSLANTISDLTDSETSNTTNSPTNSLTNSPTKSLTTNESSEFFNSNEVEENIVSSTTTSPNTTSPNTTSLTTSSPTSSLTTSSPKQFDEYTFGGDDYSISIQSQKKIYNKTSILIPFIVQSSSGERTFCISENKKFSLRANVKGDLYILSGFGQVCWICNNSRLRDNSIYGQPILELSNHGEIIFSIDGRILFTSIKQPQSGCYNLVLTNNGELITERTQKILVEINSFHRTTITKQVQSIIFKAKHVI